MGTSDFGVFQQIFIDNYYDFPIDIKPKLIIDGGANVGYASIYFANRFPNAKVIAIEPNDNNYKMLNENSFKYFNIKPIKSAIWNTNTTLHVNDVGREECGFIVEEAGINDQEIFKGITINDILKEFECNYIDILKLDIEGAEKEVFSSNYEEWLCKVHILIIELHDRFKPGCSEAFLSAIYNYNCYKIIKQHDATIIYFKN
jgi:FkbM family methyltransferase